MGINKNLISSTPAVSMGESGCKKLRNTWHGRIWRAQQGPIARYIFFFPIRSIVLLDFSFQKWSQHYITEVGNLYMWYWDVTSKHAKMTPPCSVSEEWSFCYHKAPYTHSTLWWTCFINTHILNSNTELLRLLFNPMTSFRKSTRLWLLITVQSVALISAEFIYSRMKWHQNHYSYL